ncbi:succinate dehydrogenase cytochrome b558 subunit [Virgibacillus halophilus]|uniref:succinate dehydrogenase cytochrome b558 subunit n=1 Tax=Tigheibacillus halophilus TaxID=361280 RepID=UPI0036326BA3
MSKHPEFFWKRLHSLSGLIPVGLFLIVHLTVNYFAVYGEEKFNGATEFMESLPFLVALEILVIYLPILFHGILGVYIAFTARNNPRNYGFLRNWLFLLQRVTGVLTFIFIAWHVWETRIQVMLGNASLDFSLMENILASPVMLWVYIVGVVSTTFHFSNGLWGFLVHWGFAQSPRSQKITTYVTLIVFVVVSYVGVRALFAFA